MLKKRFLILLIFISLSGWASTAHAQSNNARIATQEWKRYSLGNGSLSALLPGEPTKSSTELPLPSGINAKMDAYTLNLKQGSYSISYSMLSKAAEQWSETGVEMFYNGVWQGIAEALDNEFKKVGLTIRTTLLEKRKVRFSGHDGREISFSAGVLKGRLLLTLVGRQSFSALAVGTEELSVEDQDKFFKSITINTSTVEGEPSATLNIPVPATISPPGSRGW